MGDLVLNGQDNVPSLKVYRVGCSADAIAQIDKRSLKFGAFFEVKLCGLAIAVTPIHLVVEP